MSDPHLQQLKHELEKLNRKVDLMWRDIDFIRTHSSAYIGNQTALTHLVDETPMFINSNDFGGPSNFINGGRYEEQNLAVILSYVKPNSIFLDIGANLGFFSLQVGRRINRFGKVHSFEPHPLLGDLLKRSAYLNGLSGVVELHAHGLSDRNAEIEFGYPIGHLGGGSVSTGGSSDRQMVQSQIKRLDDIMGKNFSCDLMKIDVEGHELAVLKGMPEVLSNSPELKILFEKLVVAAGYEDEIHNYLSDFGFGLYKVTDDASLAKLERNEMSPFSGYVLACRDETVGDLNRSRVSIYPGQLNIPQASIVDPLIPVRIKGGSQQALFHGPYWFLPQGVWKFKMHGENYNGLAITIAARYGFPVAEFTMLPGTTEADFIAPQNLLQFECVGRGLQPDSEIVIERVELIRVG